MVQLSYIVGLLAIVLVGFQIVSQLLLPDKSKALRKKFVGMGNMTGKTLQEIVSVAGPYTIVKTLPDGKAYTWGSPKYAICLAFNAVGKCTKVLSEVVK